MKAITKFLVGGVGIVGLAAAAPAAAQYMPGYGSPYGYGVPGTGYGVPGYGYGNGGYGAYGGYNVQGGSQVAVSQCSAAVQQRLGYGGYGYGYNSGYGHNLGITSVEIRNGGGYRVRGVAGAGGYGGIGFNCRTDPRGFVVSVSLDNQRYGNGYYGSNYANPYNPYSVYGYQRY